MAGTKICLKCNEEKPLSDFYKSRRYHNGILSICKICYRTYQKEYRSKPHIKEKRREQDRMNPRNEKHKTYCKRWRNKHPDYRNPKGKEIVCGILTAHHKQLKDDPEHLSCDFMKKIIGVDCR